MLAHQRSQPQVDASSELWGDAIKLYIGTWRLFFGIFILTLIYFGYQGSFIFLNTKGMSVLDAPMVFLTHWGDAGVAGSILVLLGWKRHPDWVVVGLLSLIFSGLLVQLFKNTLFVDWKRPLATFENPSLFRYLLSEPLKYQSFPSGHSTSCATVGLFLSIIISRKLYSIGLAALVWIVMLTRVYTGAHFLGDVLAGGALGMGLSLVIYYAAGREMRIRQSIIHFANSNTKWLTVLMYLVAAITIAGVYGLQYGIVPK